EYMKKFNLLLIACLSVLGVVGLNAQTFYTMDVNCTTPFNAIAGTGQNLNLSDDGVITVQLPFDLTYFGELYSAPVNLRVGNNGAIFVDNTTGSVSTVNDCLPSTDYPEIIAIAWDDIDSDIGGVYYEVQGAAPNRVAIVSWENRPWFSGAGATNGIYVQVQIFEGSNEIIIVLDSLDGNETKQNR